MLSKDKASRYHTYEQITSHIWFKGFDWEALLSLNLKPEYCPLIEKEKEKYEEIPYSDFIKELGDWDKNENDSKITEEEQKIFEEWLENF